jgi:N-acetyl-anhydromuramyl-L-alanine amidase AmpD
MTITNCTPWMPHGDRPEGAQVDTVVLHATGHGRATSFDSVVRFMRRSANTNSPVSYHVLINHNGNGVKGVPYAKRAFHAGNSYGPHEQAAGVSRAKNRKGEFSARCGVNGYSVGISFYNMNLGVEPYTAAQLRSACRVIEALKLQFPGLRWITTHAEVAPGRKTDPIAFDLDKFAGECGLWAWRFPK